MNLRELIRECESHNIHCTGCIYEEECEVFKEEFGVNPSDFLDIEIDMINY